MGTIVDKLNKLLTTKSDIKAALIEKGQSATDLFSQYPTLIRNIIKLSSISVTTNPTKTSYTAKESFSSSGMVVRATFSNSAYKNVTDYTVSPSGALKPTDKSVTISYKEFGETKTTTVSISVAAIKVTVPSQSGTLTYTGSTLMPVWDNLNRNLVDISGIQYAVYAGTYTALFILKDKTNYTWADGTTADKSVTWTIGKAQASISLSKNSVTLNGDKLTDTVTITSVGMNSIAAMSSDTSIATISMSGSTLTISNVNETTGTATIVLSGEVNSNYNAPEYPTIAVNAEFAAPCTVRISAYALTPTGNANVTINGQTYSAKGLSTTLNNTTPVAEITVPSGTVMSCSTLVPSGQALINSATSLNGTVVAQQTASGIPVTYDYVVNSDIYVEIMDAVINGSPMSMTMSKISITEIPEGHVLVWISGTGNINTGYVTINGTKHNSSKIVAVPVDTVIYCYARSPEKDSDYYGLISCNGTTVAKATNETSSEEYYAEYNYTVNGDVKINLTSTTSYGNITITEQ